MTAPLLHVEYAGRVVTEADLGAYILSPALRGDMAFAHRLAWAVARQGACAGGGGGGAPHGHDAVLCRAMEECFARVYRCQRRKKCPDSVYPNPPDGDQGKSQADKETRGQEARG